MKCQHINKALDKINNLIRKMNNDDFSLYETKGPFIKEEDIRTHLDNMESYYKARTTWVCEYTYKSVRKNALYDSLSDIFDELNSCNCRSELENKCEELEDRLNDLRDDFRRKEEELGRERNERDNERTRHNNEKLQWTRTEGEIKASKARVEERLESSSSQVIELRKRLANSENQIARIEDKLDEKNRMIQELNNQLADLRVESSEKGSKIREQDSELRRREEEIKNSQDQAGQTREELLNEKLRSEKVNLELFATQLEVNLEQIHSLNKYQDRLFKARKSRNQANIATHEDNIEKIKQELLEKKINIVNIQEICRKCERMAELRWNLEQVQQQFEAHQEVPVNNF